FRRSARPRPNSPSPVGGRRRPDVRSAVRRDFYLAFSGPMTGYREVHMPLITTCPECSKTVRVPDALLGRKVRCPECKHIFSAASERPEAVQKEPPPRRPREERVASRPVAQRTPPRLSSPEESEQRVARRRTQRQEIDSLEEEDDRPRGRRLHED